MNSALKMTLTVCVCAFPYLAVACTTTPYETAVDFFQKDYSFAFKDPATLKTPITAALERLLRKEAICRQQGETCAVDLDPWTGAQDGTIVGTTRFKLASQRRGVATVRVSMLLDTGPGSRPSTRVAVVHLEKVNPGGCWAVSDLTSVPVGSLRARLSRVHDNG